MPPSRPRTCTVEGCQKAHHAQGWCPMHYQRMRQHGSLEDPRPSREERFWAKVEKDGPEVRSGLGQCWVWTASTRDGYGEFAVGERRMTGAHRFAYELLVGPIPTDHFVCHRCDNRACVRPEHLFTGTPNDNVRDMVRKGRHVGAPSGEDHHKAVLTADQVRFIRAASENGTPYTKLAERFGVTGSTISAVVDRRTWTCVA